MKRKLCVILVCFFALSSALWASGQTESAGDVPGGTGPVLTAPGTYPITQEQQVMRLMVANDGTVESFAKENNEFTREYEEMTNVHIEWEVTSWNDREQKLNLVLASRDLPDAMQNFQVTPQQQAIYGGQGLFTPLNDLIESQGFYFKEFLNKYEWVRTALTLPDGNMYAMPKFQESSGGVPVMWINHVWLDKLGLDMPTTTEEYYTVLKAFKEQDPNGNGKQD